MPHVATDILNALVWNKKHFLNFSACKFFTFCMDHHFQLSPFLLPVVSCKSSINTWFNGNYKRPWSWWRTHGIKSLTVELPMYLLQAGYMDKKCSLKEHFNFGHEIRVNGTIGNGIPRNLGFGEIWQCSRKWHYCTWINVDFCKWINVDCCTWKNKRSSLKISPTTSLRERLI